MSGCEVSQSVSADISDDVVCGGLDRWSKGNEESHWRSAAVDGVEVSSTSHLQCLTAATHPLSQCTRHQRL